MRRWRSDNIGAMIALTIVVAMVLGFAVRESVNLVLQYIGMPAHESPSETDARMLAELLPARIATITNILDADSNDDRRSVVAALKEPGFYLEARSTPWNVANAGDAVTETLRRQVEVLLSKPHLVVVKYSRNQTLDGGALPDPDRSVRIIFEVELLDGTWTLYDALLDAPPPVDPIAKKFSRASLAAWLGLSGLLALVLSRLAARRIASPLSELAATVEQIGGSGDGPPLPVRGPRELRVTIEAINRMQDRLHRFVVDRTQMLAAMSHDLRTPVTRLRLRLEMIEDQQQAEKMRHELDVMGAMIESSLSFARDDFKSEPRTLVDFCALVAGVCEDAADAGADVTFEGAAGVTLLCRPTPVRRALSNLVDNAVKYGKCARICLLSEPGRAIVTIEDEGPGIPPSQREKVFEPFVRLDSARNRDTGGVGLGLSVARSIAREHGGDVVLSSRPGGGLIARLELPA